MNINELEELAKAATPGPWSNRVVEGMEDNILSCNEDKWIVFSDESATVEQNDSDYIAAANPSAIRELIAAYREAVAALKYVDGKWPLQMKPVECALAATPEQALEQFAAKVRGQCAEVCEEYQGSAETCADAIRAITELPK